jgi:hypothetical protein
MGHQSSLSLGNGLSGESRAAGYFGLAKTFRLCSLALVLRLHRTHDVAQMTKTNAAG